MIQFITLEEGTNVFDVLSYIDQRELINSGSAKFKKVYGRDLQKLTSNSNLLGCNDEWNTDLIALNGGESKIRKIIKKIFFKFEYVYLRKQSSFNRNVVNTFNDQNYVICLLTKRVIELEDEIEELKAKSK